MGFGKLGKILIFVLGVAINGFGIVFSTRALIGTSPAANFPFALSLIFPVLTFGTWMLLFQLALILSEVVVGRQMVSLQGVMKQILVALLLGLSVDGSLFLLQDVHPSPYPFRLAWFVFGSCIVGVGVFLEKQANVVTMPADGFILTISLAFEQKTRLTRLIADVLISLITVIFCLHYLGAPMATREGTLIAMIVTPFVAKELHKAWRHLIMK